MRSRLYATGFTLIEVLIVVAIGGILASISIPLYRDYLAKAQVADSIALIRRGRSAAEEYVSETGLFPHDATTLGQYNILLTSRYVTSMSVTPDGPDSSSGRIAAALGGEGASGLVRGKVVSYSRSADGVWRCDAAGSGSTTVSARHLPEACKAN